MSSKRRRLEAVRRVLLPDASLHGVDRLRQTLADTDTPSIEARLAMGVPQILTTAPEPEPPAPSDERILADHLVREPSDAETRDDDARDGRQPAEAAPTPEPPPPVSRRGWGRPSFTPPPTGPGTLPRPARFNFGRFFGNG